MGIQQTKNFLWLSLLCIPYFLYAQPVTYRAFVKTNLVSLAKGEANVAVEKQINKKSAIEFGVGYVFSDYTDKYRAKFIAKPQIQQTEGYSIYTAIRKYKNFIVHPENQGKFFQLGLFVKVIDYKTQEQYGRSQNALKDVVGVYYCRGKNKIINHWMLEGLWGIGFNVKSYHSDNIILLADGRVVYGEPKRALLIYPTLQGGIKFGRFIQRRN